MRGRTLLLVTLASIAVSIALWQVSGGRVAFLFLPLVFAIPLLGRRR